jgi:enoyl-CoA hydratase/carnithine racemase
MAERAGAVLLDSEPGRILRATIDRPQARNAIDTDVVAGLAAAVDRAEADRVRVLVLRGSGGTFCAGADLAHVTSLLGDREALGAFVKGLADVLDRLEAAPFASLAVVEGFALAGGCEILLACDVSIAAEDARIGDRHLEYGLVPGAAGSIRLARSLPSAIARRLLLTGEMITGAQAAAWGLVSAAVPQDRLGEEAEALIERIASRSRDALATAKRMAIGTRDEPFADAVVAERELFLDHFGSSPDGREGLDAFLQRRAPHWT